MLYSSFHGIIMSAGKTSIIVTGGPISRPLYAELLELLILPNIAAILGSQPPSTAIYKFEIYFHLHMV
jgi:hypothetical protein